MPEKAGKVDSWALYVRYEKEALKYCHSVMTVKDNNVPPLLMLEEKILHGFII